MTDTQTVETQVVQEATALAKVPAEPGSLLAIIKEAAVNKADAETMKELLSVWKDAKADQAREAFANALVQFRKLVKPIIMTGERDDTKTQNSRGEYGTVKYKYAELTTTIEQIQPMLDQCQLTPTWRMVKNDLNWVEIECVVTHMLGHKESSMPFGSPVGEGRRGQTPVQVRTGVITSLKRTTLFMVLGLTTKEDDQHLKSAEQGQEPTQPKSAALTDKTENAARLEFGREVRQRLGKPDLSNDIVRTIFANVQRVSGCETVAECLQYLRDHVDDVMVDENGGVTTITDDTTAAAPSSQTGAPSLQEATPPPASYQCDECGATYAVKPARAKCQIKGCLGFVAAIKEK